MQMQNYTGEVSDKNISEIFRDAADFQRRPLQCCGLTVFAYAIDGLISSSAASEYIFRPICLDLRGHSTRELYEHALSGGVYNNVAKPCKDLNEIALYLVNGFCVVLFPEAGALAFEVRTPDKRSPSAPEVENTVKGPKDAFVETIRSNTSYIRRHLRSPELRLYETQVGRRSLTNVSVVWLEGVTNPELVQRMKERVDSIDIDGMISPASVEEYVTGSRKTAFPLLQYTERTDRFCQALLDGRIGLLVDGLPLGYLAPVDLMYLMESMEDRGRDYIGASAVRILRYLALLASLLLPSLYIALVSFHQSFLPPALLESVLLSRDGVPFSAMAEVLGVLIAFELLQESGIHLPQAIGQSVSLIGGIVVGTAAVEAGLISSVALIMVSISGVCGFVLPNRDLANAIRVWRFLIAVLASFLGLYGVAIGSTVLVLHLVSLRSLGLCYLARTGSILRRRLKEEKFRSKKLHQNDKTRQS